MEVMVGGFLSVFGEFGVDVDFYFGYQFVNGVFVGYVQQVGVLFVVQIVVQGQYGMQFVMVLVFLVVVVFDGYVD